MIDEVSKHLLQTYDEGCLKFNPAAFFISFMLLDSFCGVHNEDCHFLVKKQIAAEQTA